jgi:segregation and condensation protein A
MKETYQAAEPEIIVDDGGLYTMAAMYRRMLKKLERRVHVVFKKTQSIASRILEMKDTLLPGLRFQMQDLIRASEMSRTKLVITFLSVLELARLGFVSVFQNQNYDAIYLDVKKTVQGDVVTQVQEFENQAAQDKVLEVAADQMQQQMLESIVPTPAPQEQLTFEESATDDDILNAEMMLNLEPIENTYLDPQVVEEIAQMQAEIVEHPVQTELIPTFADFHMQVQASESVSEVTEVVEELPPIPDAAPDKPLDI